MINTPARPLDLSRIHPRQASPTPVPRDTTGPRHDGSDPARAVGRERTEAERLRAALEDIISLASSSADPSARMIQMRRRALAALSGWDARP